MKLTAKRNAGKPEPEGGEPLSRSTDLFEPHIFSRKCSPNDASPQRGKHFRALKAVFIDIEQ
jgi:hypothetical protein